MKSLEDKKLLLLGTSADIMQFDKDFFLQKKDEGYKILCFSNSITYLNSLGMSPNYFTYIDPNTVIEIKNQVADIELFNRTTSIIPNIFDDELKIFRQLRFGSAVCRSQERFSAFNEVYRNNISPNAILIDDFNITPINYSGELDFKSTFYIFRWHLNNDKFSCYLLPLIFYVFKKLKTINCIGFGQFEMHRYRSISNSKCENRDKKDYKGYIESFKLMEKKLKKHLTDREISITFLGEKSLYESLL